MNFENMTKPQLIKELTRVKGEYDNILKDISLGIFQLAVDGTYLMVNNVYARSYGFGSSEEMLSKYSNINDLMAKQNGLKNFKLILDENDYVKDYVIKFLNMQDKWGKINIKAIKDKNGLIKYYQGSIRDISQYQRNEQSLRESEEHFKMLINHIPVIVAIYNEKGKLELLNDMCVEKFGYTLEDVPTIDEWWHKAYPDDKYREEVIYKWEKSLTQAKLEDNKIEPQIYRVTCKDGTICVAQFFGTTIGSKNLILANDLTEQQRMAEELQLSEENYHQLVETSNEGLWVTNHSNQTTFVNQKMAEILGYTQQEMINRPIEFFMKEDDILEYKNRRELSKKGISQQFEQRFLRKNSEEIWAIISVTTINDNEGNYKGSLAMFMDITERKKAEEALRLSQENYRLIINSSNDMIYSYDNQSRFTSANSNLCRDMHLTEEEIIGKTHEELNFPESQCKEWDALHKKVYITNSTVKSQTSSIMPDGKLYHYEVVLNPLHDNEGNIIGITGTTHDITGRINAENRLKQSESKYRNIFENVQDIFYQTDKNDIITEISPSIKRYSGFSPSELIGQNIKMVFHDIGDRDHILNQISEEGEVIDYELRLKTKNNKLVFVSMNVHMLFDDNNNLSGLEGTLRDITERKKVSKKLKESEQRLTDIIDFLPDATFAIDQEGKVIAWNRAIEKMTGTFKEDIIGKGDYSYAVPWYNERRPVLIDLIGNHDAEYLSKYEHVDKNNKNIYAEIYVPTVYGGKGAYLWITASPLLDVHGNQYGAIESVRDITERKKAEEATESSLKEKEVLLREIHHRVKNNMQIISSLLNLQINYVEEDESLNILKESQNRVKSMAMIHEKLYQSKDFTHINISEYIERLSSDLFYSYGVRKNQITPIIKIEDIKLNIETAIPCGLIINELISNSLKYAFPNRNGILEVSLRSKDDNYELIISDNGVGFPKELDFRNTDSLGLQLVTTLTKQIDGVITLNSENGTKFTIIFKELIYKERT